MALNNQTFKMLVESKIKNKCMKKTIKKVRKIDLDIRAKRVELRETEMSIYYSKISNEISRQQDLIEIQIEIKNLLSLKYSTMESLQLSIEKMKADISYQERNLTLKINS